MSDRPQSRKWRIVKRILIGVGVLYVLSTLAMVGVEQYLLRVSKAAVTNVTPPAPLPSPNAFDDYLAATQALVDKERIEAAFPSTKRVQPASTGMSLEEKEAVVRRNAAALKHIRTGFTREYHSPTPLPSHLHVTSVLAPLTHFRQLARLLILEGQVKEARGDRAGAMNSYLDVIRMGLDISGNGMYISLMVGLSIEGMGRKHALPLVEKLSAPEARQLARRMEYLTNDTDRLLSVLKKEREWKQSMVHAALYPEAWEAAFEKQISYPSMPPDVEPELTEGTEYEEPGGTMSAFMDLQMLRAEDAYINAYTANDHRPLFSEDVEDYGLKGRIAANFLKMSASTYSRGWVLERSADARNRIFLAALALQAYRQEHGRYPPSLSALIPGLLKEVPADPFIPKSPLRYRLKGDSYLLYSVGPDGKDEGGLPMKEKRTVPRSDEEAESELMPYTPPAGDVIASAAT